MLLTVLAICAFVWLFVKAAGLMLRLAWGFGKLLCGGLLMLSLPAIILAVIFTGGVLLFVPVLVVGVIFGILKAIL